MKKDNSTWNDVKEKYLEFHKIDTFTENMAIDVDFGHWLVNNRNEVAYDCKTCKWIPCTYKNGAGRSICYDNTGNCSQHSRRLEE